MFIKQLVPLVWSSCSILLVASNNAKKIGAGIISNYVTLEDSTVMLLRAMEAERVSSFL